MSWSTHIRRLAALPAVGLFLALASPAGAETYCVAPASGCPGGDHPTVALGLSAASGHAGTDTVQLGAATYSDGPWSYSHPDTNRVEIVGAGQGQTTLTMPSNAPAFSQVLSLSVTSGTTPHVVRDLTVALPAATLRGLVLGASDALRVAVTGTATSTNSIGVIHNNGGSFRAGSVTLPIVGTGSTTLAVSTNSGTPVVEDSTLQADTGVAGSATLSRLSIKAGTGVSLFQQTGTITADDLLIELTGSASARRGVFVDGTGPNATVGNFNGRYLTIVGSGTGTTGLMGIASSTGAATQASITVRDSVINGPAAPIHCGVANADTVNITTDYSNYNSAANTQNVSGGTCNVIQTNLTNLSPAFADPSSGNYRLTAGSQLIDIGDPADGAPPNPTLDLAGETRVRDGNGDGTVRRDIGAYEFFPAASSSSGGSTTTPGGSFGPGGGAATGAALDGVAPTTRLTTPRSVDIDKLFVDASPSEASTLAAAAATNVPGGSRVYRFRRATKPARAGQKVRLRLRLGRKGRRAAKRALRRGRRLRAAITVTATDAAGNRSVARRRVRLKD